MQSIHSITPGETQVNTIREQVDLLAGTWPLARNHDESFKRIQNICGTILKDNVADLPLEVSDDIWTEFEESMNHLIDVAIQEIPDDRWTKLIATVQKIFGRAFLGIAQNRQAIMVTTGDRASNWSFIRKEALTDTSNEFWGVYVRSSSRGKGNSPPKPYYHEAVTNTLDLRYLGHKHAVATLKYTERKKEIDVNDFEIEGLWNVFEFADMHDIQPLKDAIFEFTEMKFEELWENLDDEQCRLDLSKLWVIQKKLFSSANFGDTFLMREKEVTSEIQSNIQLELLLDCYFTGFFKKLCLDKTRELTMDSSPERLIETIASVMNECREETVDETRSLFQKRVDKLLYDTILDYNEQRKKWKRGDQAVLTSNEMYKSYDLWPSDKAKDLMRETIEAISFFRLLYDLFPENCKGYANSLEHIIAIDDSMPVEQAQNDIRLYLAEKNLEEGIDYFFEEGVKKYNYRLLNRKKFTIHFSLFPSIADDGAGPSGFQ